MKKKTTTLMLLASLFVISGCDLITTTSTTGSESVSVTVSDSIVSDEPSINSESNEPTPSEDISVSEPVSPSLEPSVQPSTSVEPSTSVVSSSVAESSTVTDPGYRKLETKGIVSDLDYYAGHPSSVSTNGNNPKILVVPVEFSDALASTKGYTINDLKYAMTEDTANTQSQVVEWESVKSFYNKSSMGKLDIDFVVLDEFYTANYASSYYERLERNGTGGEGVDALINEFCTAYDDTLDFSTFDVNNDGYIDSIYFIYTHDVDYTNGDFWWAYMYYNRQGNPSKAYDGVYPFTYFFAGYEFLKEGGQRYNTHTFIHESGHIFGLEDYYEYNSYEDCISQAGGLGGADLMDYTVGDHNPFSKMVLGWTTTPTLITTKESVTIDLKPFQDTGDFIILTNSWDDSLDIYQEYFIIEFYTPTKLHAYDEIFSIPGIRVLRANAVKEENRLYGSKFAYDNSFTPYKLLSQIINSQGGLYSNASVSATDASLFTQGESLQRATYSNGRTVLNYTFTVNSITSDNANITFTYNG